jgi:hypothetical protein
MMRDEDSSGGYMLTLTTLAFSKEGFCRFESVSVADVVTIKVESKTRERRESVSESWRVMNNLTCSHHVAKSYGQMVYLAN